MMNARILPCALAAALAFVGCKKGESPEADLGLGYYPNVIGSWIEYQVDSIGRDDEAGLHDTVSYRLKEKVVEAYYDPQGRLAYRVHRMVRNSAGEWVVRDVWTRTKDNYYAESTEENMRLLKLSFPVSTGRTWDVNVYNTQDQQEVTHRQIATAFSVNGLSFPKTTLVEGTFRSNLVDTLIYEERYADGVGLVHSRKQDTNSQPHYSNTTPPVFQGYRTRGTYFTMSAVAYGTE